MMSSLHWLLIYLAVAISGTPVTRYATFKNLEMTSLCQVGVLAKDKSESTWVIQSNGNGAYSMTWDEYARKWGSHNIVISEWKKSVDGTTLEGAIGVGNHNYDDLLDKCYDVRDAVVGYLFGRNVSILTSNTCPPNERYCGHDPAVQAMIVNGHTLAIESIGQKILLRCGDDGGIARADICDEYCTSNQDIPGHALCQCSPNKRYCGHQLTALGGWIDYDNHNLYMCLKDGIKVSIIERCSNGCAAMEESSICSGYCIPNRSYCGRTLLEMGLKGYDPNAVHRCETSGQSAIIIANCSEECVERDDGDAFCRCHIGRTYCVHELLTQLNWWILKDIKLPPHQIMKCLKESFEWGIICSTCIRSQGEKDAYCQWTPGVHCGRKLNAMGWTGYDDDTVYQCGQEEKNTSVISMCSNGTCQGSTCDCIPNRTYCGYQLYLMGWPSIDSEENQGNLWACFTNGKHAMMISQCKRCTNSEGHARCACKDTELYCGHELDAHLPYGDNALYQCNNEGGTNLVKACKRSCVRVEGEPFCHGECIPGDTYCGSKLQTMGFTGYNNNSIYSCSTDGRNFNNTGRVDSLCTSCVPDQHYCGYHIRQKQRVKDIDLQWRYRCQRDGSFKPVMGCDKCINSSIDSYCQCIPGQFFCAREVDYMGWNDFVFEETFFLHSNLTDDTLLRCTPQHKVEFVEHCLKHQCVSQLTIGVSYCLCTPNRTYCGHQLSPKYNSPDTYLSLNYVYQCLENQDKVAIIRECDSTCVSVNGEPQCLQQCIHGSRYCGSDLLGLEGWTALESDVLYQCTNGSFASPELNCTQGCHGKNGDVDAYCFGMPVPWYWILMATGLPLLFISLCFGFIRTIIKHRRLQKFVQQHRINASQLTLVRKLGEGQFGEVWQSKYTDPSGQQMDVAVKISKHRLNTNDGQNLASANCFFQESVALDFLSHQNITRALGICSNLKMTGGITTPALVLEYMDGGNSADYVLSEREHLQTSDLMRIFINICLAGEHLQKMGVIHRDIGARNVLIRKHPRNGKPAVAKLTDFGLAKDVGKAGIYRSTNSDRAMFHQGYTAPEGFRGEFTSQSDVWSFGVFMWELYMLMDRTQTESPVPYSDILRHHTSTASSQAILEEICNGYRLRRPITAPNEIYSTMTSCWSWIMEDRPTFRELRKTLQAKRTHNRVEPVLELELETRVSDHLTDGGEQREEDTALSEQSAPAGDGYTHPMQGSDDLVELVSNEI